MATIAIDLAWAAGFFDGEGSTVLSKKWQLTLSVSQSDSPETLERFRDAVGGIGVVRGPYQPRREGALSVYVFAAYGYESVQQIIAMLWPYLSSAKRAQATDRLMAFRERAWANRSDATVCPAGHDRQRFSSVNSRGDLVCRYCRRDAARRALDPVRLRPYKSRPSRRVEGEIAMPASDA